MNLTSKEKIALYFLLCVPSRSLLIILLYLNKFVYAITYIYLFMGIMFLFKAYNYKDNEKGAFGGKVWWNNLRIFHGLTYIIIFIMLYFNYKANFVINILILDLLFGIINFVKHYFL